MAEPKDHDDLTVFGRVSETLKGIGTSLSVSMKRIIPFEFSSDSPNYTKATTTFSTKHNKSITKELPFSMMEGDDGGIGSDKSGSGSTFIYEQATVDGNQITLRAIGHAKEKKS